VKARTLAQSTYIRALDKTDLVFGIGPAGTGKTYLAVAYAAQCLERGIVERIILSRPAVEAGERLGFLPGDMREKVDPYLRPLYDALDDVLPPDKVEKDLESGVIEIAPLAFMRGRTLANAFVILDEAQNTTPMQMKMFLTRLGENSKMVITGDPSQIDLPPGIKSGLDEAVTLLNGVTGIEMVRFTQSAHCGSVRSCRRQEALMPASDPGPRSRAPQGADPSWLNVDVIFEDDGWQNLSLAETLVRQAATALAAHEIVGRLQPSEACIALSSDAHVQMLNAGFRGKDKPTNVLSFPAPESPVALTTKPLGDIVIARETVEREAAERGIPFPDHLRHLTVHGLLHLLGYDHETDGDAFEMESLETDILARLGIPDPYGDPED
jgi:rRNA maturation RNase YbeY